MAKLSSKNFAEEIGKTPARIRQMITDGEIKAEKIGRDWIIDTEEIEKAKNLPNRRRRINYDLVADSLD